MGVREGRPRDSVVDVRPGRILGGDVEPSGGVVLVLWSNGRSWRRGGDIARLLVNGSEVVLLLLAPDMARRRERASRAGWSRAVWLEGRSARELFGRSGVQGQGMAMFVSALKVEEGRGGVTRRVAAVVDGAGAGAGARVAVWRSAGCTFVSLGVMGLGAGLGPNSFWSSSVGDLGRSVGCVVSSLREGVCGCVIDFADPLGELMCVLGEGTMMRGEAERARGDAWRMCFGRGGRGRFIGGIGAMRGKLFFAAKWHGTAVGTYVVAGRQGRGMI